MNISCLGQYNVHSKYIVGVVQPLPKILEQIKQLGLERENHGLNKEKNIISHATGGAI